MSYSVCGDVPPARNDFSAVELQCDRTPLRARLLLLAGMVSSARVLSGASVIRAGGSEWVGGCRYIADL